MFSMVDGLDGRNTSAIIPQRLAAELDTPAVGSSFPDSVSWSETTRMLVGFVGSITAQVFPGTQIKSEISMKKGE